MGRREKDLEFLRAYYAYLCSWRPRWPKVMLDSERQTIILNIRAAIAIYGSILFWIGTWNLLTEPQPYGVREERTWELLDDSFHRELSFLIIGIVLLVTTDTLYGNAGIQGGYYPPDMICTNPYALLPRAIVGLIGSGEKNCPFDSRDVCCW